jgi:hypothetical protein
MRGVVINQFTPEAVADMVPHSWVRLVEAWNIDPRSHSFIDLQKLEHLAQALRWLTNKLLE